MFGLTLGVSTVRDAVDKLGRRYELGVFQNPQGRLSLEAYFRDAVVGGLNVRLVLSARLPQEALDAIRAHAGEGKPIADGGRRYPVAEADIGAGLGAVITAITYMPVVKFDAELVRKRFGEPAERITVKDGTHWLYPGLGLDLLLGDSGEALLQYVPPPEFERRLRAPLRNENEGENMPIQPDQYAVMGNPIAHSQSPRIHTLFATQTGQNLEYRAILVEPGGFAAAARAFRDAGGKGLNITVPFKQDAWVFADVLSARAERAGAVNILMFESAGVRGDNTDGPGLVRDLTVNHGCALAGRRILLLGGGGAARGVLQPLLAEKPAQLVIANRTASKAVELALRFGDLGPVSGCGFADLAARRFDLIINATSAGLRMPCRRCRMACWPRTAGVTT